MPPLTKYKIGDRFGLLTIEAVGLQDASGTHGYGMRCDCGGYIISAAGRITEGRVKDCGCTKIKNILHGDITGKVFGKLTCLGLVGREKGKTIMNHSQWEFSCECGATIKFRKEAIKNGNRSCGCDHPNRAFGSASMPCYDENQGLIGGKPRYKSKYDKAVADKIRTYKNNARKRHLPWAIKPNEAWDLFMSDCEYCGRPAIEAGDRNGFNGIDRIDSGKSYEKGNVCPCCPRCNLMKMDSPLCDLRAAITRMYSRMHLWPTEFENQS